MVHVRSPCAAPSFLCLFADDDPVCATCVDGVCLCISAAALAEEEEVEVEEFVPPADTVPPVLALLGDGTLVTSSDGTVVMIHQVRSGRLATPRSQNPATPRARSGSATPALVSPTRPAGGARGRAGS